MKKENDNKGRFFSSCTKCKKFHWGDSNSYNSDKFKNGSCYRCGYYGCEITDCKKDFDIRGNLIPSDDIVMWNY